MRQILDFLNSGFPAMSPHSRSWKSEFCAPNLETINEQGQPIRTAVGTRHFHRDNRMRQRNESGGFDTLRHGSAHGIDYFGPVCRPPFTTGPGTGIRREGTMTAMT
jgi:hypothetical protein